MLEIDFDFFNSLLKVLVFQSNLLGFNNYVFVCGILILKTKFKCFWIIWSTIIYFQEIFLFLQNWFNLIRNLFIFMPTSPITKQILLLKFYLWSYHIFKCFHFPQSFLLIKLCIVIRESVMLILAVTEWRNTDVKIPFCLLIHFNWCSFFSPNQILNLSPKFLERWAASPSSTKAAPTSSRTANTPRTAPPMDAPEGASRVLCLGF